MENGKKKRLQMLPRNLKDLIPFGINLPCLKDIKVQDAESLNQSTKN